MQGSLTLDVGPLKAATARLAERKAARLGDLFVKTARGRASRRTGAMADSISAHPAVVRQTSATVRVTCEAEYGRYQDEGTGIFGPEGRPIKPTHSKVLVFDWPAAGGLVFARHVKGSEPTRFWTRTVHDWPIMVRRVEVGG